MHGFNFARIFVLTFFFQDIIGYGTPPPLQDILTSSPSLTGEFPKEESSSTDGGPKLIYQLQSYCQ